MCFGHNFSDWNFKNKFATNGSSKRNHCPHFEKNVCGERWDEYLIRQKKKTID